MLIDVRIGGRRRQILTRADSPYPSLLLAFGIDLVESMILPDLLLPVNGGSRSTVVEIGAQDACIDGGDGIWSIMATRRSDAQSDIWHKGLARGKMQIANKKCSLVNSLTITVTRGINDEHQ